MSLIIAQSSCCKSVKFSLGIVADISTVPVNVGEANGAFNPMLVAVVVAKLGSSPKAAANSFKVSKVAGAESTIKAALASALASV